MPVDDSYTKLLLHCNGEDGSQTFTDENGKTVVVTNQAQIDTAQSKFGGASGLFDGAGDRLHVVSDDDFVFGNGDFTIDFWIRYASVSGVQTILGKRGNSGVYGPFLFLKNSSPNDLMFFSGTGNDWDICSAQVLIDECVVDTWYHIAVVRNGNSIKGYCNGVETFSVTSSATVMNNSYKVHIGCELDGNYGQNGWIDELRISKGIARWTANFTPPSQEYGIVVSDKMLLMF